MQFYDLKEDSGYALSFIIIVSFLITTLLVGLLTIVYFYNLQATKRVEKSKIDLACYSALQRILSGDIQYENRNDFTIDNINIHTSYQMKGLFKEVTITGRTTNDSSEVKYLLGESVNYPFNYALIISKPDANTTIAGVTKITGNILSTRNAFEKGNIFGIRNSNENYLYGNINVDKNIRTKNYADSLILDCISKQPGSNAFSINNDYILDNKTLSILDSLQNIIINGNLTIQDSSGTIGEHLQNQKDISIFVHGYTTISPGTFLKQPIEIHSDSSVLLGNNVSMMNSVITSKSPITIGSICYFKGCQFLSLKTIHATESNFEYPSLLAVYVNTTESSAYKNEMDLDSSFFNGSLMLVCKQTGIPNNKSKIFVDSNSKVQGLIYSENFVDISGSVAGIVYAYSFWYYEEPSEYINWLVNVNLNRQKLNKWFLLPTGFGTQQGLNSTDNLDILSTKWIF